MKRPAVTGSLAVETRRLLRHLDAPNVLRHNALVAHLFDERPEEITMAAIRAVVHRALDAMVDEARYAKRTRALRFRDIITRFDLAGEPADVVADDLGLSMRHFYRERRAACLEIGAILGRLLPARPSSTSVSSLYEISEAAAHGLVLAGAPLQSAVQFLSLASQVSDPHSRVAALCDAAMILTELYDTNGARLAITEATRILDDADDLAPGARSDARCLIDFTHALMLWDDRSDDADALAMHTMDSANRYMNELSVTGLRLHAGERLRYAGRHIARGETAEALRLLHESEPFIELLGPRVPFLRVDFANVRCGIELYAAASRDQVTRLASSAYEESRRQGYLMGAASSARTLAVVLAEQGDPRAAEFVDAMLEFTRNNHSPRMLAYAQIGAAGIYTALNDRQRALALIDSAIELVGNEPTQLQRVRKIEAQAGRASPKLPRS
jgi:hypothetical protein